MKRSPLKELRILFVEDDKALAEGLKKAISRHFYAFHTAYDAAEAMELFEKYPPDLVITDITMPGRSGLEMARLMRERSASLPVIVLSAYSEPQKFMEAIDVGVVKYMLKPFDPGELLDVIAELAAKSIHNRVVFGNGFVFHLTKRSLYKEGNYVALTQTQREFLHFMVHKHKNNIHVVSAEEIMEHLWGTEASAQRLRTFIKRLRQKTSSQLVHNVKSQGYRLDLVAPEHME